MIIESFSGIRGIYGKGIDEQLAKQYVYAYCKLFKLSKIVIAGDTRPSSMSLIKAMIRAFQDYGVDVINIGVVPIQTAEYAVIKFKAQGGVYITASHNEPEYNGFKFLKHDGAIIYADQAKKLISLAHKIKPCKRSTSKVINKHKQAVDLYVDFIAKKIGKIQGNVVADPNGGAGIEVLKKLFKRLGVKYTMINDKPGIFNRLIEPNEKSLKHLKGFDFAFGLDCDADRVQLVIDSHIVSGQYVLALACDAVLKGTKNKTIVTNDCTSYLVRDVIKRYNAKIKEVEVGETNVVKAMEKHNSPIGGEGSNGGVIIFPIKCRDGIMAVCLILKMFKKDILKDYPKYYSDRVQLKCSNPKIKNRLEKHFKGHVIKKTGGITGGLKIMFGKNSYLWFRQSKTEPGVFRIIADSDNRKKVDHMLKLGIKSFKKYGNI